MFQGDNEGSGPTNITISCYDMDNEDEEGNEIDDSIDFVDVEMNFINDMTHGEKKSLQKMSSMLSISIRQLMELIDVILNEIGIEYKTKFGWLSYIIQKHYAK
jgi:hypothetical protein